MCFGNPGYKIAFDNVVVLVDEQRELNSAYLADVQEVTVDRDATDRQKEEAKQYNKIIKEERKVALLPVSEALYLNCDLLFSLVEIKNVSSNERARIDAILHENGNGIFLTEALDAPKLEISNFLPIRDLIFLTTWRNPDEHDATRKKRKSLEIRALTAFIGHKKSTKDTQHWFS